MAKINGVELKAVKRFTDHEGAQIAQANVYVNGKKVGFWSQDSWGGPDNYYGIEDVITQKAKLFKDGCPSDARYYDFQDDPDIFMDHLLHLAEDEKVFKKYIKDGFSTLLIVTDGYHISMVRFKDKLTKRDIETRSPKTIESMKENMFKNVTPRVKVFNSIKDFTVVVDKNHPVPEFMDIG